MHLRCFARFFPFSGSSRPFFLLFCMQIFFPLTLLFFSLCTFLLWTRSPFFFLCRSPLRSLVLHHPYRSLLHVLFSPTLSLLYFLMHSDTVAFLSPAENALDVVTSIQSCRVSAEWYTWCIPVLMHVHACNATAWRGQRCAPRLYLGFVGDAFVTLTGSFLFLSSFFFIYSAFAECDGLGKTIYWLEIEKRIQFRRVSIYILSDSYSSKIDCASVLLYIYIYFYSRAEISNTADKRSRFSSSYIFYRSWVRRYARKSDSGRDSRRGRGA